MPVRVAQGRAAPRAVRPPGGRTKRLTEWANRAPQAGGAPARRPAWQLRRDLRGRVPAIAAILRRVTATARGFPDRTCRRRPLAQRRAAAARPPRRSAASPAARGGGPAHSGVPRRGSGRGTAFQRRSGGGAIPRANRITAWRPRPSSWRTGTGATSWCRAHPPPSRRGQVLQHVHRCGGSAPWPVLSRTTTCL